MYQVSLGPYGSPESREAYRRLVAEWMERKGRFAPAAPEPSAPALSVNELLLAYWKFASAYYGFEADRRRGDASNIRTALRVVKELYGSTQRKTSARAPSRRVASPQGRLRSLSHTTLRRSRESEVAGN
jgi:hypothetical protein